MATSIKLLSESTYTGAINSSLAELLPALQRLDHLITRAVAIAQLATVLRRQPIATAVSILARKRLSGCWLASRGHPGASVLWSERTEVEEPFLAPAADGSRLARLRQVFDLSPFDVDVCLVALAPDLDLRYERLYAYLQDNMAKKRPTIDLALNLLCPSAADKIVSIRQTIREKL